MKRNVCFGYAAPEERKVDGTLLKGLKGPDVRRPKDEKNILFGEDKVDYTTVKQINKH